MMSRGRGCIIDEPKQHVSVSTHHTARHRRKQREVGRERRELFRKGILGRRKVRQKITAGDVSVNNAIKQQPDQGYNGTFLNFSLNRHEIIQGVSNLLFTCLHLTL